MTKPEFSPHIAHSKGAKTVARNTKDTCRAIMTHLQGRGFEETATRKQVMDSIVAVAGETKTTRDRYLNTMKRYGFVRMAQNGLFTLNSSRADEDTEMSLLGDLSRRVTELEKIIAGIRLQKEAEHDG